MKFTKSETLDQAYIDLCRDLLEESEENSPRGMLTHDGGPYVIEIMDPSRRILTNNVRKINPYFLFAEFLWIITRQNRVDMLGFYNKHMYDFSDDGRCLYGAYGPRLMYQIPTLINKIKLDSNTRQAIATIFRPTDQTISTKDFPCNILLHFIPKNGTLDLVTYVRSQDLFLGLPYDFYHWSVLQELVAMETGLNVGTYTHICGSLHFYDRDSSQINSIADSSEDNFLDFTEPVIRKTLPNNIRTISTIEQMNRRNQIVSTDWPWKFNEIQNTSEDQLIKNQLTALLYYRIRKSPDINKQEILPAIGYGPLLEHLGWA